METTREEREVWASPVQHVSNRPTQEAEKWKQAARKLIRDVDTLQSENESLQEALKNIPCRDCRNPVGWPPIEVNGRLVAALRCGTCASARVVAAPKKEEPQ